MNEQQLKHQQNEHYVGWVVSLLPLRDKAFHLSTIGDFNVNGHASRGVKVTQANKPEVELYFSKENGRLVKAAYRGKSPEQDFKEVAMEIFYDDYQDHGGALIPKKIVVKRDSELFVEEESLDVQAVEKLDDSVFSAP